MMPLWLLSVLPVWTVSNACTLTLYCLPRNYDVVKAICLFHSVHEKGSTGDHYMQMSHYRMQMLGKRATSSTLLGSD